MTAEPTNAKSARTARAGKPDASAPRKVKPTIVPAAVATPLAPAPAALPVPPAATPVAETLSAAATIAVPPAPVTPDPVVSEPVAPAPATEASPAARPHLAPVPPAPFKESIMATAFETTQDTVKNTVHQLNTSAEAALTNGKAAMEQVAAKSREAVEQSMKSLDEMTDMARGNVEALMASAKAATAGIEQIASHVAEMSRKTFEESTAAVKAMTAAKTPNELFQVQSDFTKTQFDSAVAEFSKLSEMMVKLAGEVMEPMQNRVALATDKLKASFTK